MDAQQKPGMWTRWNDSINSFFFAKEVPYGLALVRMFLPTVILWDVFERWPHVRELYSTDGAPAPLAQNYGVMNFLPEFSPEIVISLYALLTVALFASVIGFCTRFSLFTVTALYFYFPTIDMLSTITKYTVISTHIFLLLSLSQCGRVWSVDAWLKERQLGESWHHDLRLATVWPQRLMQLFLGIVYLAASVTKMHTPAYFSGDQLKYWVLSDINHYNPIGEVFGIFPILLVGMSYIAIVWEVLFIFLVWNRHFRLWMLGLGLTFHLGTTISLGLFIFPLVCGSIYFAFITNEDAAWWSTHWRSFSRRFLSWLPRIKFPQAPHTSLTSQAAVYGLLLTVAVIGGHVFEYVTDPYGERRPEGRYQLASLSPERAAELLTPNTTLREKDKLFALNIGKTLMSGLVVENGREFTKGERVYVQADMVPPHGDQYLECHLVDDQNRIITRVAHTLPRELPRVHFYFDLGEALTPGGYEFVLKSNTHEVIRKKVVINETRTSLWAN